jgi:hypothetical protein
MEIDNSVNDNSKWIYTSVTYSYHSNKFSTMININFNE